MLADVMKGLQKDPLYTSSHILKDSIHRAPEYGRRQLDSVNCHTRGQLRLIDRAKGSYEYFVSVNEQPCYVNDISLLFRFRVKKKRDIADMR